MKIIQIISHPVEECVCGESLENMEIIGLGDDSNLYSWSSPECVWRMLTFGKENVIFNPKVERRPK